MAPTRKFLCGVIEGFYGRSWPQDVRLAYADYLEAAGLNACIYCPKEDPFLRRRWQENWPEEQWRALVTVAQRYRQRGLLWGVGLSPIELYRDYGPPQRRQLQRKIDKLLQLDASLLAILFDDMPGDLDALASRQAEILQDVVAWAGSVRVLVCPTYYSFDPALERHFGAMPADYWPRLGRELSADVDIFWTGNRVCSDSIRVEDVEAINGLLGRPVTLWDNYPVNDGAARSNFLYLDPLARRSTGLRSRLGGHLCNPMNQGMLSLPALAGLSRLYTDAGMDDTALQALLGQEVWALLSRDRVRFREEGLSGLGEQRCHALAAEYSRLSGEAAREVVAWLNGTYRFDPACLTD